jgi:hypothetical protein
LGETSAHWVIAMIACETGISPRELLLLDERMLFTLKRYVEFEMRGKTFM